MLVDKYITINISSCNLKRYIELGYNAKINQKLTISINHLSNGNGIKVNVKCDFCGLDKKIKYQDYLKNITKNIENKYSCNQCRMKKSFMKNNINISKLDSIKNKKKDTFLKKYGVDNISQLSDTKEKVKKTNNEKYGADFFMKTDKFKEIVKKTNNEKYGKDWITQTDEFKEKSKITNLERYGTEYSIQSDIVKNKVKQTCNLKYNEEYYMQTNEFKEKSKITNLERYGTEYSIQSDIVKNKVKESNIKNFGVEYPSQSNIIKEKTKITNLEKYGKHPSQLEDVKNKSKITNLEKYGTDYYSQSKIFKSLIKSKKIPHLENKFNLKIVNIKNDLIESFCERCNKNFTTSYPLLHNRKIYKTILCTNCNPINPAISGYENQLLDFIKENYNKEIQLNKRNIISPQELDIYLPDLKLAFEFNGLFWHNEIYTKNNYHLNKTEMCEKQRIHLIHVYEDDWTYKQEIVKSRILNLLGKIPNKIYARKCVIKEITDNKLVREFLKNNHLQGFIGSPIKLGLFYNDELVSLMTFGSKRKFMKQSNSDGVYEMLRFCSKLNTSVIGGSEKLFKIFIKNYSPKEVISYADRSWSQGELYYKLGFTFISKTSPNYYYVVDGIKKHRFNFRKDKLIRDGFDPNKSEHEIMLERKIYRIYDSGSLKFIF